MNQVKVVNNSNNPLPKYETEGAAAMDIRAYLPTPKNGEYKEFKGSGFEVNVSEKGNLSIILKPLGRVLIPSGIHVELPEGTVLDVRARSGLAIKHGIIIVNGVGSVDEDYRGDVGVILGNISNQDFVINNGDRIGQILLHRYEKIGWENVLVLNDTKRGEGGFGHTGK